MIELSGIKNKITGLKKTKYAFPLVILILGLLISMIAPSQSKNNEVGEREDLEKYVERLEEDLKKNIEQIEAVAECNVMITLATVSENNYLVNQSVSSMLEEQNEEYKRENEYLVINQSGQDSVVLQNKKLPAIRGVLVVYDGPDDLSIKTNILNAVSTVLGVRSNQVYVTSN